MQHGQGAGLSLRDLGEVGGVETITLLATNMPMHNHTAKGVSIGNASEPSSLVTWADLSGRPAPHFYNDTIGGAVNMNVAGLSLNGGGLPHNNLMPYLTLNFCIALQGAFPPRW
jgi:microcystin-dependent protein